MPRDNGFTPGQATDPHYFTPISGIPIPREAIEAAEQQEGGVVVEDALLLAGLNKVLVQILAEFGRMPKVVELSDYPFSFFIPKEIEFGGPNPPAIAVDPRTRPQGMVGWIRVKRKIHIGGIG